MRLITDKSDQEWRRYIQALPATELYQLTDDIVELVKHPVSANWRGWREIAGKRLGAIAHESNLRWARLYYHEGNRDLVMSLTEILEINPK